ncbi:hypothetical protein WN72_02230 [Bradyrhizobium arachidis]|uniref:Uncharacterized protein n=1 Tax=Bradyrhizobium arachidis TaxID=858423 RepID=A0AAE7NL79_9BRAD|nr:hypothetical protein WN72_02230 [Bradyrhizobium arachidis]
MIRKDFWASFRITVGTRTRVNALFMPEERPESGIYLRSGRQVRVNGRGRHRGGADIPRASRFEYDFRFEFELASRSFECTMPTAVRVS